MNLTNYIPLIFTFVSTIFGCYITIKITIAEIKKDMFYLKDRLEAELVNKSEQERQAKDDIKEVKDELKYITKALNDIQINFAKMEARSEGKDDVISELKEAVISIVKNR
jgi:hypothetical protein